MLSQKALTRINLALIKQNRSNDCCMDYLGRRFIIDSNVTTISWENTNVEGVTFGTAIHKTNGKYAVGSYEYQWTDNGLAVHTKVYITSSFKLVKKLIDENIEYSERYRILDARNQQVSWNVFNHHANLPDWGEALYKLVEIERPKMPIKIKSSEKKNEFLAKCRKA